MNLSAKLFLEDRDIHFQTTREASAMGVGIIHQELNLFPEMKVADNMFAGKELSRYGVVDRKAQTRKASKVLDRLQPGKSAFGDAHVVAMGKQGGRGALLCDLAFAQGGDQGVIDPRGSAAEAHQFAHPHSGADRTPALSLSCGVKPHKQVAREHRLLHDGGFATDEFFGGEQREVGLIALACQVGECHRFLPGFAANQEPGRCGWCNWCGRCGFLRGWRRNGGCF